MHEFMQKKENYLIFHFIVKPNANKTDITKIENGMIYIDIHAVPDKNKANKELINFLSKLFNISKNCIKIVSGTTKKTKTVVLEEISDFESISKKLQNYFRVNMQ